MRRGPEHNKMLGGPGKRGPLMKRLPPGTLPVEETVPSPRKRAKRNKLAAQ